MSGHERYERLAVGHVLGGLDEVDAAAFRAHLLDCPHCRRRVNELRDIASDLAATEREERRAASRASVEVETRTEHEAPEAVDVAPVRRWPWGVVVLALVPLLVLGTLAWAVWQRAQTDLTEAVAASQQRVLEVLATGEPVDWTPAAASIEGDIATDGMVVAVNLVGLPELRPDEALVVWLLDRRGDVVANTQPYLPSQVDGRLVAAIGQPVAANEFVVSIETDLTALARPEGHRLVEGTIPALVPAGSDEAA